jgi:hypothetical protein
MGYELTAVCYHDAVIQLPEQKKKKALNANLDFHDSAGYDYKFLK